MRILPNYHQFALDDACADALMRELAERRLTLLLQMRIEDERSQYPLMKVPGVAVEAAVGLARRFPAVAWQASGGVRDAGDLRDLQATGVAAAISGRALLEGRMQREELEPFLRSE